MSKSTILIIGSLPHARTNAAHLTDQFARSFAAHGLDVHCLIDTLGQAPTEPVPYRVHRHHQLTDETFDVLRDLPRLYVVGSHGDSLFAFEQLQNTPGAVIVADNSLLPLAPALAALTGQTTDAFARWLTGRYGEAGWTMAQAAYGYRRRSIEITHEVSAYGFTLPSASKIIALSSAQQNAMQQDGLEPELACSQAYTAHTPKTCRATGHTNILIVGASQEIEQTVDVELTTGTLKGLATVTWRYAAVQVTESDVLNADAVFLLDQTDAAVSPLHAACLKKGNLVLTSGQAWGRAYHTASMPPLRNHPASVVHTLAALTQIGGLSAALVAHQSTLYTLYTQEAGCGLGIDDLLTICSTASAGSHLLEHPHRLAGIRLSAFAGDLSELQRREAVALAGCVPIPPILSALQENEAPLHGPKFIEKSARNALADFMGLPNVLLPARMGFEAPAVSYEANSKTQQATWAQVSEGLLARQVIVWGLPADTISTTDWMVFQGAQPNEPAEWDFQLSSDDSHLKPDQLDTISGFDGTTGMAWSYDPLRNTAKIAFMTGGPGQLSINTSANNTNLMLRVAGTTDVQTLTHDTACIANIAEHGLAMLELADVPSSDQEPSRPHLLLHILCEHGLQFRWNPDA